LDASEKARAQLTLALDEQRGQAALWQAEAQAWRGRHGEMEPKLKEKEAALNAALQRYEDACRIFKDEMAERVREIHRLNGEVARARGREQELEADHDARRRAIDEERERLRLQADKAIEGADSIRRDVFSAIEDLRGELKDAVAKLKTPRP
jgi:hypothetical protein